MTSLRRGWLPPLELGREHQAARPAHANQFTDRSVAVDEHRHRLGHHAIEVAIGVGQSADVSRLHRYSVADAGGFDVRDGPIQHVGRDVCSRDCHHEALCHGDGGGPHATADVEHLLPKRQCRESEQFLGCLAAPRMDHLLSQEPEEKVRVRLRHWNAPHLSHCPPPPGVCLLCRSFQAKATVLAPATISSTILAAPTMLTPSASCSGVMPRGLAQAPQSHTLPWLAMNSAMRSWSFGSPVASTPSLPPLHPRRTASIVQRTTASCPVVAAMLAAMKGSVARSGSSRPQVQLKISFSFISVSPQ